MFQRRLYIDSESYIEVSSRIHEGEDKMMLTISGPKSKTESTMISAILSDENVALLSTLLQEGLGREVKWKGKESGSEE